MPFFAPLRHTLPSVLRLISCFAVALTLCVSCSTKRNTAVSRGYQRMTSRYNVYYNAREAFKSGIESTRKAYHNDYSHVLPVYEFSNERAAGAASGDMETTLKKAHKLIQLHSITVKPDMSGPLSDEDKRFRAKTEYNPYVAEAHLLIGKAYVVMHNEQEAIEQFDYISRLHEGEHAAYEAHIWKSIAYTQIGQYSNAQAALKSYDMDGVAPSDLYADFQAACANTFIAQGLYAEAIPYVETAAADARESHCRNRYSYILAQLYRATGQRDKSAPIFLRLSRLMSDYDMAFAAKLDLPTVASTDEELAKAEKTLSRMARDPKNKEQLDQVYYAIGHLDLGRGDKAAAKAAFTKSVEASVSNDNQKGLSFLSLADIYQAEPEYIDASTCLDSAAFYLDDANDRKSESAARASLLAPLAKELRTIRDNDSLLRIARMPSKERDELLERMAKEHNDKLDAIREAKEADEANAMSQTDFYQIQQGSQSGSSWYFYNNQIVAAGKSTFRSKWGNRKNEDDWRRSNRQSKATLPDGVDEGDEGANAIAEAREQMSRQQADAKWTRESLMKDLPMTADAQQACDAATAKAMLRGASILYDDVHDYVSCAKLLEEYKRRFPQNDSYYDALALLHFAQSKCADVDGQANTDVLIVRQFPESLLAKSIKDPSFSARMAEGRAAANEAYKHTYEQYLGGDFSSVIARSTGALDDDGEDLRANYLLLRAMAYAKTGQSEPFRSDLLTIRSSCAGSPQDSLAVKLLAMLDEGRMPARYEPYDSPLAQSREAEAAPEVEKVVYAYEPDSAHVVVCFVDAGKLRDTQFTVADYNFSNFIIQDYDVAMAEMPHGAQAVVIGRFANRREAETYFYALREQRFWSELSSRPIAPVYMMSVQNERLLRLSGPDDEFLEFMKTNYGI